MSTTQSSTLAQIVNADHRTAFVFEKYKLDFCCRGKRTLLEACREAELPVELIEKELETLSPSISSAFSAGDLSVSQLADHIVEKHHSYVKNESPLITKFLDKIASKHGIRHPELVELAGTFNDLAAEMNDHMEKEEQEVFPLLKSCEVNTTGNEMPVLTAPIALMEDDHAHAGKLLEKIRVLTADFTPPADACTTYKLAFASLRAFEMDLHQHVHLENNMLFPMAMQLLERNGNRVN